MTQIPLSPDMNKHEMRMTLLDYAKGKGVASGDVLEILHKFIEERTVPSYLAAKAAIDQLKPPKPEVREKLDWGRTLMTTGQTLVTNTPRITSAKFDGKNDHAGGQSAMSYEQGKIDSIRAILKAAQSQIDMAMTQLDALESRMSIPDVAPVITVTEPAPVIPVVEEPLVINAEWQAVLDTLKNGTEDVFITGGAGTGKSTLLKHFTDGYMGNAAIVAPTGVAALRVGGETIHRFFGFGAHALESDDIRQLQDSRRAKYRALDLLIIDEISMVRADLMDAIDIFLRKNGRDKDKPFGGVRLVMFGDLFQLPPVSKEKDERKWLMQRYGTASPYFFHADCWRDRSIKVCQLTTIFRQKDAQFTDALNAIRNGTMTKEHLALINSRVQMWFAPPPNDLWLTLTTTNNAADQANAKMLAAIPAQPRTFEALVSGDFDLKNAPTDEHLELKPGAAVMFIRNDSKRRWVNGTLGQVAKVDPLMVAVDGTDYTVEPEIWESITYEFDPDKKRLTKTVKGQFSQIPLKLAAAITIHKSQGLSLDKVIIDLGGGTFAAGQGYVALSRCRSLEGTVLRRPLKESDIIVSSEVVKFIKGEPIARPAPAVVKTEPIQQVML